MDISVDPGLAIGFSGVVIALVQLRLGHRKEILENTIRVFDRLQERAAREDRFNVRKILNQAAESPEGFDGIPSEDRARLTGIASTFGFAGLMARKGKVDLNLVLQAWGNSISYNHERLKPYRKYRDDRFGSPRASLWGHFDWLAERADQYMSKP